MHDFWWDDLNIEHIAEHNVEVYEAEEVIEYCRFTKKAGRGKVLAFGQTLSGRYLIVVFAPKSGKRIRVVTARDMTYKERRAFLKRRK